MIAFARNSVPDDVPYIKIGNNLGVYCDGVLTRLTDRAGFFSRKATRKLIKEIQEYCSMNWYYPTSSLSIAPRLTKRHETA